MIHTSMHLSPEHLISAALSIIVSVQCANFTIGGHFLHASLSQLELLWHDEQGIVRTLENIIAENPFKWPALSE